MLLWVRARKVAPEKFWQQEAPKVKWLNILATQALSVNHAAGGCERNFSTHTFIFSSSRQRLAAQTLARYVKIYRNMRLRDAVANRGVAARKEIASEPKRYPLESGEWSSCDDSEPEHEGESWNEVQATMGF